MNFGGWNIFKITHEQYVKFDHWWINSLYEMEEKISKEGSLELVVNRENICSKLFWWLHRIGVKNENRRKSTTGSILSGNYSKRND